MAQRQPVPSFSLERHIRWYSTPDIDVNILPEGFFEIKKGPSGHWAVTMCGGTRGSSYKRFGLDNVAAWEYVGQREKTRGKNKGPAAGLYLDGYLNIEGTWSEKWSSYDGEKCPVGGGDMVLFKMREGVLDGQTIEVDACDYASTVQYLKSLRYHGGFGGGEAGEDEGKPELWLLRATMNCAR